MKRYCLLAALMLLSPSAYAGNSVSFVIGGHRIHIEAPRYCRSPSCVSVSTSGIYRKRDRYDDEDRYEDDRDNTPVKPQPAPPAVAPSAPPVVRPPAAPVVVASPAALYKPAASTTRIVAAPPPPPVAPTRLTVPPAPLPPPPVATPVEPARPAPQIARVAHEAEEETDSPIGDWQTEGRGTVRIGKCGNALCGYVLSSSTDDRGEAVLINMKPKNSTRSDRQWTGSVYSRDSGDTYYGTIELKAANTLRVEACAFGRFYCSGNNWSRIVDRAESLMSSRPGIAEPRS